MIRVDHLTKEFTRPKRQTGRFGGLRTLVTREVERTTAVDVWQPEPTIRPENSCPSARS